MPRVSAIPRRPVESDEDYAKRKARCHYYKKIGKPLPEADRWPGWEEWFGATNPETKTGPDKEPSREQRDDGGAVAGSPGCRAAAADPTERAVPVRVGPQTQEMLREATAILEHLTGWLKSPQAAEAIEQVQAGEVMTGTIRIFSAGIRYGLAAAGGAGG